MKKSPIDDRAAKKIMEKVESEIKATGTLSSGTAAIATIILLDSVSRRLDRVSEKLGGHSSTHRKKG